MYFKWVIGAIIALAAGLVLAAPASATEGNQNEDECQYGSFQEKDEYIPGYWTFKDIEVKDYFVPPEYKTEYKVKELVKEAKGYIEYEWKKGNQKTWDKDKPGNGWQKTGKERFVETKPAEYKFYWTFNPGQHTVVDQREVKVKDGYWVYKTIQVKDEYIPGYWTYKTVCLPADCGNPLYFDANIDECDPEVEVCVEGEIVSFRTSQNPPQDDGSCEITELCIDGKFVTGTVHTLSSMTGTDDCEVIELCYEGEDMTATQHELNNNPNLDDAERRACIPQEDPRNDPDPDPEPDLIEEVEEDQQIVAEVAPAVDLVAVLPAAGNGGVTGSSNIAWIAALGLALIGFGGATVMAARRS